MAEPAVVEALADEHWRVREMAAKVVSVREVGSGAEAVARLVCDEVVRVRVAALRAIAAVGEGEHMAPVRELLTDQDPELAALAEVTLTRMGVRLDRPIG